MGLRLLIAVTTCSLCTVLAAAVFGSEREAAAGWTSELEEIHFEFGPGGRPVAFETMVNRTCSFEGGEQVLPWTPRDGAPVRFRWSGNRLRVAETSTGPSSNGTLGRAHYTMDARLLEHEIHGTVEMNETWERGGKVTARCWTGKISFRVQLD